MSRDIRHLNYFGYFQYNVENKWKKKNLDRE